MLDNNYYCKDFKQIKNSKWGCKHAKNGRVKHIDASTFLTIIHVNYFEANILLILNLQVTFLYLKKRVLT